MTVAQVIEHLKTYPPDHQVMFIDQSYELEKVTRDNIEQRTAVVDETPIFPKQYQSTPKLSQRASDVSRQTFQVVVIGEGI